MYEGRPYPDTDVDIVNVQPIDNVILLVEFANGIVKSYDVKQLFDKYPQYKALEDKNLFNSVKHGRYFVYWNSELDIAEVELWYNGEFVSETNEDIENIIQYWTKALSLLEKTFSDVVYHTWIKPLTPCSYNNNIFTLKCERDFEKATINNRYLIEITRCLRNATGKDVEARLISPEDL